MMRTGQIQSGKQFRPTDTPKRQYTWSTERRRYVRYLCAWRVRFCELNSNNRNEATPPLHLGKCKDLSQCGMKISSFQPLSRNAIVLLEVDLNLFAKHIKTDNLLLVSENRILAEVRWRHLNLETRLFEAGLEFLEARRELDYQEFIKQAQHMSS